MDNKTIKLAIPVLILVLLAMATYVRTLHTSPQTAPDVSFLLLEGRQVTLSELGNGPVLIAFWASTCHLCLQDIPHLIALYDAMKPDGLEIIGVAMPYDPPNRVLETRDLLGIPYPVALDLEGKIISAFGGVSATPTTILISRDGKIISRYTGPIDMEHLRGRLLDLTSSGKQPGRSGGGDPA
jgi:thiol-disulfide isomerase/thioredoxin